MKKQNKKYELICALVNQGFTDAIVDAARNAGASGGTVLNTRAATKRKATTNYGIAIAEDKELITILTDSKNKTNIMEAIYKVAGIETEARGLIFTLPADNVVGLRNKKPEEKKEK